MNDVINSIRPVVFTCDQAYAMPLATALRSIAESNQADWPLNIHILSNGFTEATRYAVSGSLPSGSASIRWRPVDVRAFDGLSSWAGATRKNYARLLIPKLFPASTERILYLDPDIIVMDRLHALWTTDLEGAAIGAVLDTGVDPLLRAGKLADRNVPRVDSYFNSGAMLIDLPRWRSERISERALEYLRQNPATFFSDQDAFNVACDGRWKPLDGKWNYQRHLDGSIDNIEPASRPTIVHFVSTPKPWDPTSLSENAAFYDDYRRRTRFARTKTDKFRDICVRFWTLFKRWLSNHLIGVRAWTYLKSIIAKTFPAHRPT
ncbi:MAG TPA: glycosyltransferase family 8 protein [Opitutus sp.]|nr:glycosyltransferase family 8 protein [Opitutus sp.]